MFDRFTERVRKVIQLAREEAARFNHDYIGTEHLLLGLVKEGEGIASAALANLGVDLRTLRLEVEKLVEQGPATVSEGDIPFNPQAKKVLELSVEEARKFGHNYIGTEHLLLGLIKEGEGIAAHVLDNMKVDVEKVQREVVKLLGGTSSKFSGAAESKKTQTPALDAFGRDLTEMARQDKLDPVIGREDEIERVIQILSRRTKNNPVLIGEAGVGKTAIVEGLAQAIINKSENIPDLLVNRRVMTLDLAGLVAGTKYRGQFEERLKAIMAEIRESNDSIIFIDELHTIVGAGGGFLVVPVLVLLGGLTMHQAVGTALVVIVLNSTASFVGYLSHETIDYRLAAVVSGMALVGAVIGSFLSRRAAQELLLPCQGRVITPDNLIGQINR